MTYHALKIGISFYIIFNLLLMNLKVCLHLYFMRCEFLVYPDWINIYLQIDSDLIQFVYEDLAFALKKI